MANVLDDEKRLSVLAMLVKNAGARNASDVTGVHRDTIGRFGERMGWGCARLHDRLVRDLTCAFVDMDEQHSWCFKRQQNLPEGADDTLIGEQWTWAAIDRTSKLTVAWTVGKRNAEHADELVGDVRARLTTMPMITTDGCPLYVEPIGRHFGYAVPYIQTVKQVSDRGSRTPTGEKFSPRRGVDFIVKRAIYGAPDFDKATTYAVERSNLTNRTWNARLNRRTIKFSKDLDRHKASVALMYVFRNLCHVQSNMKVQGTAAMAAGVADHVWSLAELMEAALAEPAGERPTPRPLAVPRPAGPARELPGDRGWLRALPGGGEPAVPPPPPPPAVPAVAVAGAVKVPASAAPPVVVRAPAAAPEVPDLDVPPPVVRPAPVPAPAPASAAPAPTPTPLPRPTLGRGPKVNPGQLSLFGPPEK